MEPDPTPAPKKPPAKTARDVRLEREAAALRANLRKRKDRARAREAEDVAALDTVPSRDLGSPQVE